MKLFNIAILGATGVVGRTLLSILQERKFPVNNLFLLASSKSSGKILIFQQKEYKVKSVEDFDFKHTDLVFGCAGSEVTKHYLSKIINSNCILIDEASFLRTINTIPLIVPEINGELIKHYKNHNIIASPNCCATPIAMILNEILKNKQIKRVCISSYQSYSGAGKSAVDKFLLATKENLPYAEQIFQNQDSQRDNNYLEPDNISFNPDNISFNIVPKIGNIIQVQKLKNNVNSIDIVPKIGNIFQVQKSENNINDIINTQKLESTKNISLDANINSNYIDNFFVDNSNLPKIEQLNLSENPEYSASGYTTEEEKIIFEVCKLLNKRINISVTSVRVPVLIGHSFSCNIEFTEAISEQDLIRIKENLILTNGVDYKEDLITPREIQGTDFIYVSRIRISPFDKNVIEFMIMCDNLRKGAALNSVQIAENLINNFNI